MWSFVRENEAKTGALADVWEHRTGARLETKKGSNLSIPKGECRISWGQGNLDSPPYTPSPWHWPCPWPTKVLLSFRGFPNAHLSLASYHTCDKLLLLTSPLLEMDYLGLHRITFTHLWVCPPCHKLGVNLSWRTWTSEGSPPLRVFDIIIGTLQVFEEQKSKGTSPVELLLLSVSFSCLPQLLLSKEGPAAPCTHRHTGTQCTHRLWRTSFLPSWPLSCCPGNIPAKSFQTIFLPKNDIDTQ